MLVGADGIWSQVRAAMRDERRAATALCGHRATRVREPHDLPDNGEVGYGNIGSSSTL